MNASLGYRQVPRLSLTIEKCSRDFLRMSDENYKQVLHYYRRCLLMARLLESDEDRLGYVRRIRDFLQETWYDFIWQSELGEEQLVRILEMKENIDQQLSDTIIGKAQARFTEKRHKDMALMSYAVLLLIALVILVACAIMASRACFLVNRRSNNSSNYDLESVRKMYLGKQYELPPSISSSSLLIDPYIHKDGGYRETSKPASASSLDTIRRIIRSCCSNNDSDDEEDISNTVISLPSSGVGMDEYFQPIFILMRDQKKNAKMFNNCRE